MDEAAKESGVSETAKDLRAMTSKKNLGLDKIEEAARKFESWDPAKAGRTATKPAPGSETAKLAEKKAAEAEARGEAAATTKTRPAAAERAAARATKAAPAKAAPAKPAKAAAAKAKAATSKAKPTARKAKPKATDA
jgi:sec-independent protein translocase protein TatB